MVDEVEIWVTERYGKIRSECVRYTSFDVWVSVVPVYGGAAIGMGGTEKESIHDLYCDLVLPSHRQLRFGVHGIWLARRRKLDDQKLLPQLEATDA